MHKTSINLVLFQVGVYGTYTYIKEKAVKRLYMKEAHYYSHQTENPEADLFLDGTFFFLSFSFFLPSVPPSLPPSLTAQ